MTIRFLQTCASENPAFPFMAGQVITVTAPSPFLLGLLDGVRAEIVKGLEDPPEEQAIAPHGERPEPERPRPGRRHAR